MLEVELLIGALVAQGKKEVDKQQKSDVKSKTIEDLITDDPFKALVELSRRVQPQKH